MLTHADKIQENKSQSVTTTLSQRQNSKASSFQFENSRPEAIAQRKLQKMANSYSAQKMQPIQQKENKTGLPDNLKTGIEKLSGYAMDDVKVHYNSDKPAHFQAHAYAQGTNIHLAPGQEKHLAHEAWHVVQQKQGRVKPTMQMKGQVNLNDDARLEKEADVMGAKVRQLGVLRTTKDTVHPREISHAVNQRITTSNYQAKLDVVQKVDVVENIVLQDYKKDKEKLKVDLANCIDKFTTAIDASMPEEHGSWTSAHDELLQELSSEGRDAFFYRSIYLSLMNKFKKFKLDIISDLERFDKGWHISDTGALLSDIGLALKNVPLEVFTGGLTFQNIMNEYMQTGSDHVRKRREVTNSSWVKDLEYSKIKGKAGPSSTTTQLLHVVSSIGTFTDTEVEAMMIALVKFWKKPIKRLFGKGYHTAAEVWAPYTSYLDEQRKRRSIPSADMTEPVTLPDL